MIRPRPFVLIILDGWGYRAEREANAIALALTPNYTQLLKEHPWTLVYTSGEDVGLPAGLMGNSEVGHLNIGAGRIVDQDILRITRAIRDGALRDNPVLAPLMAGVRERGRALHLMGLVSDGGVHSLDEHPYGV